MQIKGSDGRPGYLPDLRPMVPKTDIHQPPPAQDSPCQRLLRRIVRNKNGARRRRFFYARATWSRGAGEQASGLFVFQVGVALQTQLQLVEQGLAGRVVQRRVGDDALVVLANDRRVDVDVTQQLVDCVAAHHVANVHLAFVIEPHFRAVGVTEQVVQIPRISW